MLKPEDNWIFIFTIIVIFSTIVTTESVTSIAVLVRDWCKPDIGNRKGRHEAMASTLLLLVNMLLLNFQYIWNSHEWVRSVTGIWMFWLFVMPCVISLIVIKAIAADVENPERLELTRSSINIYATGGIATMLCYILIEIGPNRENVRISDFIIETVAIFVIAAYFRVREFRHHLIVSSILFAAMIAYISICCGDLDKPMAPDRIDPSHLGCRSLEGFAKAHVSRAC